MSKKPLPTQIELHRKSRVLEIAFDDGARYRLPCEFLRVYSPSAEVRGHTPGAWKLQVGKERVNITELLPVGQYAVKIVFDDGHKTGLYDWGYLYKLGRDAPELWQRYLERLHSAGEQRDGPDPFASPGPRGTEV
jgi:DUF971 family protein